MILIYGKGLTGEAAKNLAEKHNIDYIYTDDNDFNESILKDINEIIVSPGIPFYHKIFRLAKKYKKSIIGEIEFAYRFYRGNKILAITGTDGKSTTTKLIQHILNTDWEIGGNYGIPFSELVLKNPEAPVVLELSSFQIYSIKDFKPDIAVILNISTDHLDWHKRFLHYKCSKYKLIKNLKGDGVAILNYDDNNLRKIKFNENKKVYYFSLNKLPENIEGIYLDKDKLVLSLNNSKDTVNISNTRLQGIHNIQNIMASVLTAYVLKRDKIIIESRLRNFEPLPYRMEFKGQIKGVNFINDAKSTTVQSVLKALESFDKKNVYLILGGINKGGDFSILKDELIKKVKRVYLIGKDKENIFEMINGYTEIVFADNLEEAVKGSFSNAKEGDYILFSPGCASFDMFKNYKDRGQKFNSIFEELKNA